MSEPQRLADLLEPHMVARCGCGAEYDAPAIRLGDRMRPTLLYCPACQAARAEAERERAERDAAARIERETLRRKLDEANAAVRRSEAVAEAQGLLSVPPLYADVTLDRFQFHGRPEDEACQRAALNYARRWVSVFPKVRATVSVFTGAPGSGKGHVAWSLAKAVAETGHRAEVVKLADLVRALRASWGQPRGDDTVTLEHYRRLDLLIVDEVSRHAFYGQPVQHLYDVLDHRIEQLRPTILTTNETDEGLRAILSPALWNRIEGHGGIIEFGQASWRRRGNA